MNSPRPPLCIPPPPPKGPMGGVTVTWPKKHRKYEAPKLMIYTVILRYSFGGATPPPPLRGGNCHFVTVPHTGGGSWQ